MSQRSPGNEADLDEFIASTRVNQYETGIHQPNLQILQQPAKVLDLPARFMGRP